MGLKGQVCKVCGRKGDMVLCKKVIEACKLCDKGVMMMSQHIATQVV